MCVPINSIGKIFYGWIRDLASTSKIDWCLGLKIKNHHKKRILYIKTLFKKKKKLYIDGSFQIEKAS